jgi:hypothetical protein
LEQDPFHRLRSTYLFFVDNTPTFARSILGPLLDVTANVFFVFFFDVDVVIVGLQADRCRRHRHRTARRDWSRWNSIVENVFEGYPHDESTLKVRVRVRE